MTAATSFFRFTHDSKENNVDDGADHSLAWHYFLRETFWVATNYQEQSVYSWFHTLIDGCIVRQVSLFDLVGKAYFLVSDHRSCRIVSYLISPMVLARVKRLVGPFE